MRRKTLTVLLLLLLTTVAIMAVLFRNSINVHSQSIANSSLAHRGVMNDAPPTSYLYYILKTPQGFMLARARKGSDNQPVSSLESLVLLGDGFGQVPSDSVVSMSLSPDGRYLAIDGTRADSEQVWMYDTLHHTVRLLPAQAMGNFLHWLPGQNGHTFLYRPMFPLGPAPMDSTGWHPGLWLVDAATGAIHNLALPVPSAFLVDAAPSPDGTHIIYSTSVGLGEGSDVWLMHSDGSQNTHLFGVHDTVQSIVGLFAWSPDGTQVAYERLADSEVPFLPASLWVMNSQGQLQRQLAITDGGHGYAPLWSPDGSMIAYVARTNFNDQQANFLAQSLQCAIGVVTVATDNSRLVATPQQTGKMLNINPVWAADSNSVTFMALNPINLDAGGTPRYWSATIGTFQAHSSLVPLTSTLSHIAAA